MAAGEYSYTFTVFTPTYNRAHTLHRVYESLRSQTFTDFEWLIVDDGSTDDTPQRVAAWREEAAFPIRYIRQENQGKHVAFNRGVREARGELFLTLDSDDACVPQALERFKHHWDGIAPEQKHRFSAVTSLCRDQDGNLVGKRFPKDVTDSDSLEIRYRYKVTGEKWGFHRTEVLRRFPFPEGVRRHYVPEGIVWSRIARAYRTRFVNEALRIYYVDQPSMVHGGTAGKNAVGSRIAHLTVLNEERDYFRYAPLQFCRSAALYVRSCFYLGHPLRRQVADIDNWPGRALWLAALPIGFAVYRWEIRRSRLTDPGDRVAAGETDLRYETR